MKNLFNISVIAITLVFVSILAYKEYEWRYEEVYHYSVDKDPYFIAYKKALIGQQTKVIIVKE